MPLLFKPGDTFPDIALADHTGAEVSLSVLAAGKPLLLAFYRGYW